MAPIYPFEFVFTQADSCCLDSGCAFDFALSIHAPTLRPTSLVVLLPSLVRRMADRQPYASYPHAVDRTPLWTVNYTDYRVEGSTSRPSCRECAAASRFCYKPVGQTLDQRSASIYSSTFHASNITLIGHAYRMVHPSRYVSDTREIWRALPPLQVARPLSTS